MVRRTAPGARGARSVCLRASGNAASGSSSREVHLGCWVQRDGDEQCVAPSCSCGSDPSGACATSRSGRARAARRRRRRGITRSVRARSVRTRRAGHRHQAEVEQELGEFELDVSVTAVELVRGALCTAHITPSTPTSEKDLWRVFREAYGAEPFVRIVHERAGLHRHPDPKILAGSNYADVGFAVDERSGRVVTLCAIDNLVKGGRGQRGAGDEHRDGYERNRRARVSGSASDLGERDERDDCREDRRGGWCRSGACRGADRGTGANRCARRRGARRFERGDAARRGARVPAEVYSRRRRVTRAGGRIKRRSTSFQMAVCGRINPWLVTLLRARMVDAVGLSGLDGGDVDRNAEGGDPLGGGRAGRARPRRSERSGSSV